MRSSTTGLSQTICEGATSFSRSNEAVSTNTTTATNTTIREGAKSHDNNTNITSTESKRRDSSINTPSPSNDNEKSVMFTSKEGTTLKDIDNTKQEARRETLNAMAESWTPKSIAKQQGTKFIAATQNMRGLKTESDREEIRMQMVRQGIHVICGQETWIPQDQSKQRWETGELFINVGGQDKYKHEGVCFFLSSTAVDMFEQGGQQLKTYGPRLATIRLKMKIGGDLYIVNAHAPDSGQTEAKRSAFQRKFEQSLRAAKRNDVLMVMGDFNASTGTADEADEGEDDVRGTFGIQHINKAGKELNMTAGMFGLQDLLTFQQQPFYGSWMHMQSKRWHQLDKIYMRKCQRHMVNKCTNAEMLTDSDHFSVRLNLTIRKQTKPTFTERQKMNSRKLFNHFSHHANPNTSQLLINDIVKNYGNADHNENEHNKLLTSVQKVLNTIEPTKKKKAGWCDVNLEGLQETIATRDAACLLFAKTKTDSAKTNLRLARKELKKQKMKAKNRWILRQMRDCNESVLPVRGDRKNPYAIWKLASKIDNGLDKWKSWDDSNVKKENGQMAHTPEENAEVFQTFFNDLFSNDSISDTSKQEYMLMEQVPVDREWGPPTMWEMEKALKKMKHTAAGNSGIPSSVWQACATDETLKQSMLKVMINCWENEEVPEEWTTFHMTVLFKKGNRDDVANYRGISMAETLSKLYTSILKRRLEQYYEELAPEYCNGFRMGRGRNDSIFTIKEILRKRKAKGLESYCVFYDFIKCFDKISRECIWRSMSVMGVHGKMIQAVKATLKNSKCNMNIGGVKKEVTMKEGSGQGTTLGPTLCNYFFLPLLYTFEKRMKHKATFACDENGLRFQTMNHSFADDTCMLLNNREDTEIISREFNIFAKKFSSKVHVATSEQPISKSVIVHIPANNKTKAHTEKVFVNIEQTEWIDFVTSSPYLGSKITTTLCDDDEINGRIRKAIGMFGKLRKNLLGSKDVNHEVKRKVITGMLLPIMLDGAESWIISTKAWQLLKTAYHRIVRGCLRYSLYTTRKHKITIEDMLNRLGLQPLPHYLDWRILGYAGHVQRMTNMRLPKRILNGKIEGKGSVGAPPKSYSKQLLGCLKRKQIPTNEWQTLAHDKNKWRNMIKRDLPFYNMKSAKKFNPEKWEVRPGLAVGRFVEKKFGHKFFAGVIQNYDLDTDTNEQIWSISYDDGDTEDLNADQLKKVICDEDDDVLFQI